MIWDRYFCFRILFFLFVRWMDKRDYRFYLVLIVCGFVSCEVVEVSVVLGVGVGVVVFMFVVDEELSY